MRLNLTPSVETKDGISNKNARLTNCLKEVKKSGEKAVVRPGLVLSDTYSGIGNGLIPFDGRLLLIYDDTVYDEELSVPWPFDALEWNAATNYGWGDVTWYLGDLWFSWGTGSGNTPGSSSLWKRSYDDSYNPDRAYDIGDSVVYNGVTYYNYVAGATGIAPDNAVSGAAYWVTTPPGTSRYNMAVSGAPGSIGTTGLCASKTACVYAGWNMIPYTCSSKNASGQWFEGPAPFTPLTITYLSATQYIGDCTTKFNQGLVTLGQVNTVIP